MAVPVIDISPLVKGQTNVRAVADELSRACRESGFFYIRGHGIDETLQTRLDTLSRVFFSLPESEKMKISMEKGGIAWRGFFPVGGELTSGKPDIKEGIYFGSELDGTHPAVKRQTPLHGANLFPDQPVELKATVLKYIDAMTTLGHTLMRGLSLSLGLEENFFASHYTSDPLVLFRIFHYPPPAPTQSGDWGVGEHTDYGVLTILKQDENGGLEVKSGGQWISAPPIADTFVCNIGDMLDRMTSGLYKSTPHRVRNSSGKSRLSFPFFFDPDFSVKVQPLDLQVGINNGTLDHAQERWDRENPYAFDGTYGDYVLRKVGKVFPQLGKTVLKT